MKRVFLIVLDSFGIGELPDAAEYGDKGTNTLGSVSASRFFHMPNMKKMGLFNIDGVRVGDREDTPLAVTARMTEASKGKDTTMGHWEIAGIYSGEPMPTFPKGFPKEVLEQFSQITGRGVICNKPYSGTDVIMDYGDEHVRTGKLIVYTSADSVFQVAAHEAIVPLEELYSYCEKAREMLMGQYGVGRVIARPFTGADGIYDRMPNRHDYSLLPPAPTMLDQLKESGKTVIGVGKIKDIFAGRGITEYTYTKSNREGNARTLDYLERDFEGLCFVNLVDFDMQYGHRNDIDGYAKALDEFDASLPAMLQKLKDDDILMITADHGCDPGYIQSTDHSREYTPFLMYGKKIGQRDLGTRDTFSDIGATVVDYFDLPLKIKGTSML